MGDTPMHIYEFGPFRVDALRRLLLRDGNHVRLPAKAFEILLVLLKEKGRLVEKDELIRRVWPDVMVEENNLTVNMSALRRSLTESPGEHRYVITVPGRGYQFVADVRQHGGEHAWESEEEALANQRVTAVSAEPRGWDGEAKPHSPGSWDLGSGPGHVAAAQTNGAPSDTRTLSSAEYIGSEIKRHKHGVLLLLAALLATTIIVSYLAYSRHLAGGSKAGITSIAVLPFANKTGDPNAEYLSDGISESLINSLSQLPGVKVIARSSAFKYKGTVVDIQEVAHALGVEAVLTGRVLQRGDGLIISVELVDARKGTQVWGEQYSRKAADIQEVQKEIARAISDKLRLRLSGAQEQQLTNHATQNPQAYQAYLNGLFYMRKGGFENVRRALEYYNQAVTLDPNFALAWVGIANAYRDLQAKSLLDPKVALARAKAAAQKALELDEMLPNAHALLARIKHDEWDLTGAERGYKRAIELNPNMAESHSGYSQYLSAIGRHTEALAESKRAEEIDPLQADWMTWGALYSARRSMSSSKSCSRPSCWSQMSVSRTAFSPLHMMRRGCTSKPSMSIKKWMSIDGETTSILCYLGHALDLASEARRRPSLTS